MKVTSCKHRADVTYSLCVEVLYIKSRLGSQFQSGFDTKKTRAGYFYFLPLQGQGACLNNLSESWRMGLYLSYQLFENFVCRRKSTESSPERANKHVPLSLRKSNFTGECEILPPLEHFSTTRILSSQKTPFNCAVQIIDYPRQQLKKIGIVLNLKSAN